MRDQLLMENLFTFHNDLLVARTDQSCWWGKGGASSSIMEFKYRVKVTHTTRNLHMRIEIRQPR